MDTSTLGAIATAEVLQSLRQRLDAVHAAIERMDPDDIQDSTREWMLAYAAVTEQYLDAVDDMFEGHVVVGSEEEVRQRLSFSKTDPVLQLHTEFVGAMYPMCTKTTLPGFSTKQVRSCIERVVHASFAVVAGPFGNRDSHYRHRPMWRFDTEAEEVTWWKQLQQPLCGDPRTSLLLYSAVSAQLDLTHRTYEARCRDVCRVYTGDSMPISRMLTRAYLFIASKCALHCIDQDWWHIVGTTLAVHSCRMQNITWANRRTDFCDFVLRLLTGLPVTDEQCDKYDGGCSLRFYKDETLKEIRDNVPLRRMLLVMRGAREAAKRDVSYSDEKIDQITRRAAQSVIDGVKRKERRALYRKWREDVLLRGIDKFWQECLGKKHGSVTEKFGKGCVAAYDKDMGDNSN